MKIPLRIVAAGLAAASLAYAQDASSRFVFRLGGNAAFNKGNSDTVGFSLGAGYILSGQKAPKNSGGVVSLDFLYSRLSGTQTRDAYDFGVTDRIGLSLLGSNNFYYGLGVGVRVIHLGAYSTSGSGGSGGGNVGSTTTTTVYGELSLGYNFNPNLSLELGARVAPDVQHVNTSGVTLLAGYRF